MAMDKTDPPSPFYRTLTFGLFCIYLFSTFLCLFFLYRIGVMALEPGTVFNECGSARFCLGLISALIILTIPAVIVVVLSVIYLFSIRPQYGPNYSVELTTICVAIYMLAYYWMLTSIAAHIRPVSG